MRAEQAIWLARMLEVDPQLVAAERALRALGDEVFAQVSAALASLARKHEPHASLAFARAPEVWTAGGPESFARWLALGSRLLHEPPLCRAGASRYFALSLQAFGASGLDTAEAWCALGRELTGQAPHLGRMFFERTAGLLTRPDVIERLRAWIAAAQPYLTLDDWRADLVLEAYFDTAAESVYVTSQAAWLDVACALADVIDPRRVLARARGALDWLSPERQSAFLGAVARWATESPEAAAMLLERLPPLLAATIREAQIAEQVKDMSRPARALVPRCGPDDAQSRVAALYDVLSLLPARAVRGVGALLPALPSVLAVPATELSAYLAQVAPLAAEYPEAALAALRALPELHRRADAAQSARWFAHGAKLARENVAAAQAFFALESRTSLRVLAAGGGVAELDQSLGVWRKLIHMLSDRSVVVRRLEEWGLRPPLEASEPEGAVSLPEYVDWFPTHAQNLTVYRFLALQLAGRLEHGTYRWRDAQGQSVQQALERDPHTAALRKPLFLVAEGVRIAAWTLRAYPGSARETVQLAQSVLQLWQHESEADLAQVCDMLLALSLVELETGAASSLPACVPAALARVARGVLALLHRPQAGVAASLVATDRLALLFDPGTLQLSAAGIEAVEAVLAQAAVEDFGARESGGASQPRAAEHDDADTGSGAAPHGEGAADADASDAAASAEPDGDEDDVEVDDQRDASAWEADSAVEDAMSAARGADEDFGSAARGGDEPSAGRSSARAASAPSRGKLARQRATRASAPLAALAGLTPSAALEAGLASPVHRARPGAQLAQSYVYDEWDHTLSDYRSRHCHVHELALGGDQGEFFAATLRDNRELLAQVRRQFEHMRPERYRVLRGLEDGEDFDLNALTEARVESRAGRTGSSRIYTARTRQTRDVATLFLLDMSASTEQPYLDATLEQAPRRIIDTLKEALVVMCTALDTLGDAYAIYGFSSQGRKRVELFEVKAFDQPLGAAAKSRLGSIAPRHGTRMGAALRHSSTKLASVHAHAKHLILLSDGFPQDQEYGEDRRTHTYGIKDTAVALRELTRAGTLPFCITVDRAGRDYLRLMCDPDQYMVIDHIEQLPRELPKIYRRLVR